MASFPLTLALTVHLGQEGQRLLLGLDITRDDRVRCTYSYKRRRASISSWVMPPLLWYWSGRFRLLGLALT